jgi:carbonic anhydrase
VAGNAATEDVLGSIELGTAVAGAKLVVVLGNGRGWVVDAVVESLCNPAASRLGECPHLSAIVESISGSAAGDICRRQGTLTKQERSRVADEVARHHVADVVRQIRERSEAVERLVQEGRLGIVGMMYEPLTGSVRVVPGTVAGMPESAVNQPGQPAPAAV